MSKVEKIADRFPFQVVSMDKESAKTFAGMRDEPRDLGPADEQRYKPGARRYGWKADAS